MSLERARLLEGRADTRRENGHRHPLSWPLKVSATWNRPSSDTHRQKVSEAPREKGRYVQTEAWATKSNRLSFRQWFYSSTNPCFQQSLHLSTECFIHPPSFPPLCQSFLPSDVSSTEPRSPFTYLYPPPPLNHQSIRSSMI